MRRKDGRKRERKQGTKNQQGAFVDGSIFSHIHPALQRTLSKMKKDVVGDIVLGEPEEEQ